MDANHNHSLPTGRCFKLPLPKPINVSFSSFKYHDFPNNNNNPTTSQFSIIPCQQTLNVNPIGKPLPNKRGRKPLTTMPVTKKHVQNLTNQRAFRQRKESYLRNLENKALNLEMLYSSAQNEIKVLNEKVEMLEKKLASTKSVRNGGIVGSAVYQAIIENQPPIYTTDEQKNKNGSCDVIMSDFTTPNDSYTSVTVQLNQLKENDLSLPITQQISPKRKSTHANSMESVDEIIQDPDIYCDQNPISPVGKYILGHKTGWIPPATSSSSLYSTFASDSSRNTRSSFPPSQDTESQWQSHPYFDQSSSTAVTQHHRLNLTSILAQD